MISHATPAPLARSGYLPSRLTETATFLPDECVFLARCLYGEATEAAFVEALRDVDDDLSSGPLLALLQTHPMPTLPIALLERWRSLRERAGDGIEHSTALFGFHLALATGLRVGAEHFAKHHRGDAA